jgi:hypothetical protein
MPIHLMKVQRQMETYEDCCAKQFVFDVMDCEAMFEYDNLD